MVKGEQSGEHKMYRLKKLWIVLAFVLCLSGISMAQVESENPKDFDDNNSNNAKQFYARLAGDWEGSYRLWMRPDAPALESDIKARFQDADEGNQFLMTYTWKKEGKTHDGIFVFLGEKQIVTATWGDSFHMYPQPMICNGEVTDGGKKLVIKGSYGAGDGPDWGWRTEFVLKDPNSLLMEAFNITPEEVEALAVKAEMKRVGARKGG